MTMHTLDDEIDRRAALAAKQAREDSTLMLARHQAAQHLPYGIVCTCGAEMGDLNAPVDDATVTGRGLALAVHQMRMLDQIEETR